MIWDPHSHITPIPESLEVSEWVLGPAYGSRGSHLRKVVPVEVPKNSRDSTYPTWRIIPVSKQLVTPFISRLGHLKGE